MEEIAPGVSLLRVLPCYAINAYLVGDVVIDAGIRPTTALLLRQLRGQRVVAHALTHAHPDHQGASRVICKQFGVPLWCGERDAAAMECGNLSALLPPRWSNHVLHRVFGGPGQRVARALREGDTVAGFEVIATPGHSPGHVSFWRERDRVLILGDVLAHGYVPFTAQAISEPHARFTCDIAENRRSAHKLVALHPRLVCFGHGPPLHNTGALEAFVKTLS